VTSGLSSKRLDAYREICEFLIQGWRSLGVDLYYGSAGREYRHNPNCFGTATGADLVTAQGYKFIGSAQLRRGKAILQHGSIRLQPDAELFTQVFGEAENITVVSPHPKSLSHGERDFQDCLIQPVMDALTRAVADCFGVELIEQPLSSEEWQAILAQPSLEVGSPLK
ncbi:MAG TPA: lipoate--protein ligase family protein, partial [Coleofasciculaceae cyanobacterium]